MAGKSNISATFFAQKKLLGKAHTSNLKVDGEELIGSNVQAATSLIFGEDIPTGPAQTLYLLQSASDDTGATVEYIQFTLQTLTGTTYDANVSGGGEGSDSGESSQSSGPHCYKFVLPSDYVVSSSNARRGNGTFDNGKIVHQTLGSLQIIPPFFSQDSPNPFIVKIYKDDSGAAGDEIPLLDNIDWNIDYYNGILFLQDYDSNKIPGHARAFAYVGKMSSEVISSGSGGGAGDITSVTAGTGLSGGGASGAVTLNINDSVVATLSGSQFSGNVGVTGSIGATTFIKSPALTGSLTKLTDGTSYLQAGSNITITTGSTGQITITSADADTNTQNTLDQAYDEGATGAGAIITVDDQPVQIKVAGASSVALVVTGTAIFGSSSVATSNHLPPLPGTNVSFYVSGTQAQGSSASPSGVAVFGGDIVVSGTLFGGSPLKVGNDFEFNTSAGSTPSVKNPSGSIKLFASEEVKIGSDQGIVRLIDLGGSTAGKIYMTGSATRTDRRVKIMTAGQFHVTATNFISNATSNDFVRGMIINSGAWEGNVGDFQVQTENKSHAIYLNTMTHKVSILSTNNYVPNDIGFFVSGSKNSTSGSLFGGDLTLSGTLFAKGTGGGAISGSITRVNTGLTYLVAGDNVTISSSSNGQITIAASTTAGSTSTSRKKAKYHLTSSVAQGANFQVGSTNFNTSGHKPKNIDIFLNGQLLHSGTAGQVASDLVDYTIIDSSTLRFSSQLEASDVIDAVTYLTASTGAVRTAAQKTVYSVTASHASDVILNISGLDLSVAEFDPDKIAVFLNGQMMTSGSSYDYTLAGIGNNAGVKFTFDLEKNDIVTTWLV